MFAVSQIEVNVSARSLTTMNDPNKQMSTHCVLLISNSLNDEFILTDKTELNDNCLNPDWNKRFIIAFKFSEIQTLRFDVYKSWHKTGETVIRLSELIAAKDGFTMKAIKSQNRQVGKLLITYKEVETNKETVLMDMSAKNLDKKDTFGESDPYLIISNIEQNGNVNQIYTSQVVRQTVSPVWKAIKIKTKALCQSNRQMKLLFECMDWDSKIKVDLKEKVDVIGSFTTSLE